MTRPLNAPRPVTSDFERGNRDRYRDGYPRDRDGYQRDRDGYQRDRDGYPRDRDWYQRGRLPYRDRYGYSYYPFRIADAPLARGGVVYYAEQSVSVSSRPTWFPTGDKPRWRRDTTLAPVQAWIDLIVNDVVCDGYGTCIQRESRARAPWVPVCRCYLLTDALGRRWEIE